MGVILTFTNNLSNPVPHYIRRPPQSLLVGAIYRTSASITSDISSSSSDPTNQSSSLSELVDRFFVLRFLLPFPCFPCSPPPSEGHSPIRLVPCGSGHLNPSLPLDEYSHRPHSLSSPRGFIHSHTISLPARCQCLAAAQLLNDLFQFNNRQLVAAVSRLQGQQHELSSSTAVVVWAARVWASFIHCCAAALTTDQHTTRCPTNTPAKPITLGLNYLLNLLPFLSRRSVLFRLYQPQQQST